MDVGRAIGFIAGGAAEGYGKGIVEQARLNWDRMLKEEGEARADARVAKNQEFEINQAGQRQTFEAGEKEKDRNQRIKEHGDEIKQRDREFDVRTAEAKATREENKAYREATLAEQRRYRQDQYNLRLREIEGKEAQITTGDMKKIEDAEKSLLGEFPNDDDRATAAPKIVAALREAGDQKLANYYAALHSIKVPTNATSTPTDEGVDDLGIPKGAAPGLGGGKPAPAAAAPPASAAAAPAATPAPAEIQGGPAGDPPPAGQTKPVQYPNALWSAKANGWVVKQPNGKWAVVE